MKVPYQHGQSITITVGVGGGDCTNGALDTCPRNRPGLRSGLKPPMARVRVPIPRPFVLGRTTGSGFGAPAAAGCPGPGGPQGEIPLTKQNSAGRIVTFSVRSAKVLA